MNLRNQKGINMITLSIAIIITIIITGVLAYNSGDSLKIRNLRDLYNDVELLNSKISSYYIEHGDIPKSAKYENLGFLDNAPFNEINPNNGNDFYVIDLNKMQGITLNYGRDYERIDNNMVITSGYEDLYIINEISHTIYYPRGIDMQGKIYYTHAEGWKKVELSVIPIYTAEQLAKIGSGDRVTIDGEEFTFSLDANYILKNDIDLSSVCYKVDGTTANDKSWTPIGATEISAFTGKFYGNGHEIRGIYINSSAGYRGLFGYNNGTIQDITVSGTVMSSANNNGGISGTNLENGKIITCISKIQLIGNTQCGGICGNNSGVIKKCKNFEKVEQKSTNSNSDSTGGIVGDNTGTIEETYNEGMIIGRSNYIGGIAGINRKEIKRCINNGEIQNTGNSATGGIVAFNNYDNAKIICCYNKKDISGVTNVGGIVGNANKRRNI